MNPSRVVTRYERNRWKFEHVIRNMWGTNYGRFTTVNISKYEYFTRKNQHHLFASCVSVVVSGDFCCFKLALPSLLFLSKDEVKAAHSDFDRCPRGGGLRTENPPDRHFLSHILRSKIIAPWDMSQYQNSPRISLETIVFYLNFQVRFFLAMLWTSKLDTAADVHWSTAPLAVERKLTSYPRFFQVSSTDTQDVSKCYWFYE